MGIWGYLLLGVALALGAFAYYMLVNQRCLAAFQVSTFTIEPAALVYITNRGDYQQLMPVMEAVRKDLAAFLANQKKVSEDADVCMCGVYYDMPQSLVNPKEARALIGFLVRDDDHLDVQAFLKFARANNRPYAQIRLGRIQAFGAAFPLMGQASMMANIVRGYPAIQQWVATENSGLLERVVCSMETYQWSQQSMGISFVYGKSAQALFGLSKYPQPAIKSGVPVKTVKKLQ